MARIAYQGYNRTFPAVALAGEDDPIVEPERLVLPELDGHRRDAETRPIGRTRHLADGVFGRVHGHGLLQGEAALERARLLARPGADTAVAGAALEIGVRLGVAHLGHRAAGAYLPAEALPVHDERSLRVRGEFLALGGFDVGVEHEARLIRLLE